MKVSLLQFSTTLLAFLTYVSIAIQWLWFMMAYLMAFKDNTFLRSIILPTPSSNPSPNTTFTITSDLSLIIGGFVTILAIFATLYIAFKLPKILQRSGDALTVVSSDAITAYLQNHKKIQAKDTAKTRFQLTQLFFIMLITPPLLGIAMKNVTPLTHHAAMAVTIFAASASIFWAILYLSVRPSATVGTSTK